MRTSTGYSPGPAMEAPKMKLGALVMYYDGGWRYGYLAEETKAEAKVRPISAYKAATPRCIWCKKSDVKEVHA